MIIKITSKEQFESFRNLEGLKLIFFDADWNKNKDLHNEYLKINDCNLAEIDVDNCHIWDITYDIDLYTIPAIAYYRNNILIKIKYNLHDIKKEIEFYEC